MSLLNRIIFDHPIATGVALLLIALFFRLIDIFVLRLDDKWGEIILSKVLGFVLVILFVTISGLGLKSIGLHAESLLKSLLIGAVITIFAMFLGYLSEYIFLYLKGMNPTIFFDAIDPKTGASGGFRFGLWLLFGNIINSFMEEGLFRGVLLGLFTTQLSVIKANWFQAFLFGGWHLPWVLKGISAGQFKNVWEIAFGTVANFVPQLFMGMVWGFLYIKANSLWVPWISHTITNSALNFLHIKTDHGVDEAIAVRMVIFVVVMLMGMLLMNKLSNWMNMNELKLWQ